MNYSSLAGLFFRKFTKEVTEKRSSIMDSKPGTYAIVMKSSSSSTVQVGSWGPLDIRRGYYIYVGSAFGPGVLLARVSRHCRMSKRKHWHIDYLREFTEPLSVWYSHSTERVEHMWADALFDMSGAEPVDGFGCSDCRCRSHLFFFRHKPFLKDFRNISGCRVESCLCRSLI